MRRRRHQWKQQSGVPLQMSPATLSAQVHSSIPLSRHWQALPVQSASQSLDDVSQ